MKKIQYGCGPGPQPKGWINFDSSPTLLISKIPIFGHLLTSKRVKFEKKTRYGDIVKGIPIREETCDAVFCSHVLEHLSYDDFLVAIKNTHRILKNNSIFGLIVPDFEYHINQYINDINSDSKSSASISLLRNTHLGYEKHRAKTVFDRIISIYGNSRHLWMWDKYSLTKKLENVGFHSIKIHEKCDSDNMFNEVVNEERLINSLFITCRK